jgi:hypothetical protein
MVECFSSMCKTWIQSPILQENVLILTLIILKVLVELTLRVLSIPENILEYRAI